MAGVRTGVESAPAPARVLYIICYSHYPPVNVPTHFILTVPVKRYGIGRRQPGTSGWTFVCRACGRKISCRAAPGPTGTAAACCPAPHRAPPRSCPAHNVVGSVVTHCDDCTCTAHALRMHCTTCTCTCTCMHMYNMHNMHNMHTHAHVHVHVHVYHAHALHMHCITCAGTR